MKILLRLFLILFVLVWGVSIVFVMFYTVFHYIFTGKEVLSNYGDWGADIIDNINDRDK